jgi:2-polyprenyl-3-methyl-5-hydroxy-6-metoxy-1,4-benzoquinol methylase
VANQSDNRERQIQESWEANADAWTHAVWHQQIESRRLATDEAILQAVLQYQPRRVLDVGCGEGWLTRAIADRGLEVVGIDGSQALINRASQRGGSFAMLTYEQIISDPATLGQPYDAIVCNFSLLGEEIGSLLQSLREIMLPGGHLFIQTVHPFTACQELPYIDGWRTEIFDSFGETFLLPMPWYFRTVNSWFKQLSEANWTLQAFEEPMHPDTKRPLSLLLICS